MWNNCTEAAVTAISGFSLHHRLIAYRAALDRIVDVPGRLGLCSNRRFHGFGHLLGLARG